MLDTIEELHSAFTAAGIPLINEDTADSSHGYPIVTYDDSENTDAVVGTNMGYSYIAYTITVWAKSKAEVMALSQNVDNVMKSLEFDRTGGLAQNVNGLYRNIWTYRRICKEIY